MTRRFFLSFLTSREGALGNTRKCSNILVESIVARKIFFFFFGRGEGVELKWSEKFFFRKVCS